MCVPTDMVEPAAGAHTSMDQPTVFIIVCGVAFAFGAKTADPMTMYLNDVFTIPTNLAGHPALSVPFGTGEAGLPIGVQLLGPGRSEAQLFAAARVLEIADGRP